MNWIHPFSTLFRALVDPIAPPGCFTCSRYSETPLCQACYFALVPLELLGCQRCGNPQVHSDCVRCHWCNRLSFLPDHLSTLFPYHGKGRQLFHQLKYQGYWRLLDVLFSRGSQVLFSRIPFCDYEAIVPIPQPLFRGCKRLFNPADQIARQLSLHTGLPLIDPLGSTWSARAQVGLSVVERAKNVRGRFFNRTLLKGANILVVDDVLTSGATLASASQHLKAAGATKVAWFTVFRSLDVG